MVTCDVLIAGGGPAGSSCAWKLRRAGADVVLVDKAAFPRDKVCGGWITPAVLDCLEVDPADYRKTRVLQPITGFRTGAIGGGTVETSYGHPVSYGIRRRQFDEYLLRRCGAQVFEQTPVTRVERHGGAWIVNQFFRARILIGAGGHFCPVAHAVSPGVAREHPVVAQESEFPMTNRQQESCLIRGDTPELYFCPDFLGYGWCFRKGDVLNVGLGRADTHRLSSHVQAFIAALEPRIGCHVPAPRGHAYLVYGSSRRAMAGDGWMLIGDAAGLAHPISGEGILPAIESGLLAAETILAGHSPESYAARISAHFTAAHGWMTRIGSRIPARVVTAVAPAFLRSGPFARRVILDRWFLHRAAA